MRFRDDATLDSGQVSDRRGVGRGVAVGGGGAIGLIVLLFTLFTGGDARQALDLTNNGVRQNGATPSDLAATCRTGADANQRSDCRIVAVVNSVQDFWAKELPSYEKAPTVFFSGSVTTGCGRATAAVGPFYCSADATVYIDLAFYDDLRNQFGAQGGAFAEAYVIAHEYGHHVEDLTGTLARAHTDRSTGPLSGGVRVELQADCLAGRWAGGALATGFIAELTEADIRDGLDAAAAVGDDRIQAKLQGQVRPESFTHGSAASRQKWFLRGYRSTGAADCDTFATNDL